MKKKITQLIQAISISSFLIAVYGTKYNHTDTGIQDKFKCKQERNAFYLKKYESVLAKKIKAKLMGTPSLEINTEFKEIKPDCDNLNNLSSDIIINNNKLTDEEQIIKGEELIQKGTEFSNKLSESNDKWESLYNYLSNWSIDEGLSSKFIDEYWQFIETLDFNQKWALIHISGTTFILISLFSIIATIYGDKLIIYLNLEKKYPKIAKFIELRRKIKQSYIILNGILIIMVLVLTLYINIFILFNF